MKENLYQLARKYIDLIEKIEKTSDPEKLEKLEESRSEAHWNFIECLKRQGIKYKNRDHATRIAYRIANREL